MNVTGIEWTTFSANPLKYRDKATGKVVWACIKHSPGCLHCYSETLAIRYGNGGPFTRAAMEKVVPFIDDKELRKILTAKTVGGVPVSGSRVFIGDMTDVFGEWVTNEMLDKMFAVFALRKDVTFQVLTKRADRMAAYMNRAYCRGSIADAAVKSFEKYIWWNTVGHERKGNEIAGPDWPLPNCWLGTSVERQQEADERIPHLLRTPAAVRFLSCEPLLGPVDLTRIPVPTFKGVKFDSLLKHGKGAWGTGARIDWAIVGGESGHKSRPFHLDWAKSIQDQCDAANVPVFFKQAGSNPHDWTRGDPANHDPPQLVHLKLRDRKGGDLSELPHCLNVRDFPEARA